MTTTNCSTDATEAGAGRRQAGRLRSVLFPAAVAVLVLGGCGTDDRDAAADAEPRTQRVDESNDVTSEATDTAPEHSDELDDRDPGASTHDSMTPAWLLPAVQIDRDAGRSSPGDVRTAILRSTDGVTWSATATVPDAIEALATDGSGAWVGVGSTARGFAFAWSGVPPPLQEEAQAVILHSDDGSSWTVVELGLAGQLHDVATDGQRWVAVGSTGLESESILLTSDDGLAWTETVIDSTGPLHSVAHNGAGTWVTVGTPGVFVSADGHNWEPVGQHPDGEAFGHGRERLGRVTTDGSLWVAADLDVEPPRVFTSPDATLWNPYDLPGDDLWDLSGVSVDDHGSWLAFGHGGAVAISHDAHVWTEARLPELDDCVFLLRHAEYNNGLWLTGGVVEDCPRSGPILLTSSDALTWKIRPLPASSGGGSLEHHPGRPAFGPAATE